MDPVKIRKWFVFLLLLVLLVFSACGCEMDGEGQSLGANVSSDTHDGWAEIEMDLCAITSEGTMAETVDGYYARLRNVLYYADKEDLNTWVPVCNAPECSHDYASSCTAYLGSGFLMKDERLLTVRDMYDWEQGEKSTYGLYDMSLDGTEQHLVRTIENSSSNGSITMTEISGDAFYGFYSIMQTDGTWHNLVIKSDTQNDTVVFESNTENAAMGMGTSPSGMRGDYAVYDYVLYPAEASGKDLYRLSGEQAELIPEVQQFDLFGSYLRGDSLYRYEQNAGFFRTDISSGESEKLLEANLTDGHGFFFTEDFLVEANLYWGTAPEEPEVLVYDGTQWKQIALPEDFVYGENATFYPYALTTEHMFFRICQDGKDYIYYIALADEEYTMSLCGVF